MSDTSLYKAILKELTKIIEDNKNISNYKLPSERALSTKYDSSRPPIRMAYQKLIEENLVEVVHGKGYFIKNTDSVISKRKTTPHVLFVAPSIKSNFMQQIRSGMSQFCENNNVELSFKISDESEKKEQKLIESVLNSNYDGLILFPIDNEYYNEPLLRLTIAKFPTVIIDRYVKNLNLSFISTDNYNAMADTVKYLHDKKYKNLVYVTLPASIATTNEDRINGFNHGLLKYYGAALASNLLILKSNDRNYIYSTIKKYLQENPQTDALIINGVFISAAHVAVSELNISVPDKLRIVAFDNEITFSEKKLIKPIIIEQKGTKIGYLAGEYIYNQIMGNKKILSKKFPVRIIDEDVK